MFKVDERTKESVDAWSDDQVRAWLMDRLYAAYRRNIAESVHWNEESCQSADTPDWNGVYREVDFLKSKGFVDANIPMVTSAKGERPHAIMAKLTATGRIYHEQSLIKPLSPVADKQVGPKEQQMNSSGITIFISHAYKDQELARQVIGMLEAALHLPLEQGKTVIRATSVPGHKANYGAHISTSLRDELVSSKVLIGLITPNSLGSNYVLFELGAAWGQQIRTVPLMVGVGYDKLEGPLREVNALRLDEGSDSVSSLLELIEQLAKDVLMCQTRPMPKISRAVQDLVTYAETLRVGFDKKIAALDE